MNYIDIHSHLLYEVDDGSKSLEQSKQYLLEMKKIGLQKVVCTPHMKYGSMKKRKQIQLHFAELVKYAKVLDIDLYLGSEILWSEKTVELLQERKLATINNTNHILLEFKRNEYMPIGQIVTLLEELKEAGYQVVLAHPELYTQYRKIDDIYQIKETGTMIQIDASSLFSKRVIKQFTKKLLKEKLVDVVASDSHCHKKRNFKILKKAYRKINKKYGKQYTDIIFYQNPFKIIGGTYEEK